MSEDNFNAVYVLSSTPRPGTIDNGTAEYALTRNDDSDTVLCYMELPMGDADFWSRILRSQAFKAWNEGAEAQCGQDNGGPMAENPYLTTRTPRKAARAALPKHRANGPYLPVGDLGGERCVTCRTQWPCDEITKDGPYPRCSGCLGSLPLEPMFDCTRRVDHYHDSPTA